MLSEGISLLNSEMLFSELFLKFSLLRLCEMRWVHIFPFVNWMIQGCRGFIGEALDAKTVLTLKLLQFNISVNQ